MEHPKIIHVHGIVPYKPTILGLAATLHSRKPPYETSWNHEISPHFASHLNPSLPGDRLRRMEDRAAQMGAIRGGLKFCFGPGEMVFFFFRVLHGFYMAFLWVLQLGKSMKTIWDLWFEIVSWSHLSRSGIIGWSQRCFCTWRIS